MSLKLSRLQKIDAPVQQSKSLSLEAYNLILISFGVLFLHSRSSLSGKFANKLVPPAKTISEYNFFLRLISVLLIEFISN